MRTQHHLAKQLPGLGREVAGGRKQLVSAVLLLVGSVLAIDLADARSLTDIRFSGDGGSGSVLTLVLDEPVSDPKSFAIAEPARIAVDLPATSSALQDKSLQLGSGVVEGVTAVEAGGRTRVVVKLSQLVTYTLQSEGSTVRVLLDAPSPDSSAVAKRMPNAGAGGFGISNVDFRRDETGSGRVIVNLTDPRQAVDVRHENGAIVAEFVGASLPSQLERRLDVADFATPVRTVDFRRTSAGARLIITPSGNYDHIAYQTDGAFTIEVKPLVAGAADGADSAETIYSGERLSLSFQDIELRSVLQLIADFTGQNMVVSDTVKGNITLRLQDVPWDQALDIILKTKGLAKREKGNVILVAPAQELAERDKLELEARNKLTELAPLRTSYVQINYAKAQDVADLLQKADTRLLSDRGRVGVDTRTNLLIVRDTDESISAIRNLVAKLDVPVSQVLIESRIVIASDDFARDLGVRFGYSRNGGIGDDMGGVIGGTLPGNTNFGGTTGFETPAGSGNEGLMVDLPAPNPAGAIGLAIGRVGSYLLQLELSAMESEGKGSVVSSPRVITANQKAATIEQGFEIPYSTVSDEGTETQFKKAVLGLTVTPQITPDDRVLLDLRVSKDSVGQNTDAGPVINTQAVQTQVLVDNGETVVLGGVYERTSNTTVTRVPLLGELPFIGHLFRGTAKLDNRSELLIFVTPKILKESLRANQ